MKKILRVTLKIIVGLLLVLLVAAITWVFFTGPELPKNTDIIIEEVINSEIPEFVTGKSGHVISDGYKIWYECITPEDSIKGTVMLFMGISGDALIWPTKFLNALVDNGYQVIRHDYRSTGASDWIENYDENPYSLADLTKDAVVIMDTLNIEKTHLFGISMGGMVAQDFAIHYPNRCISLTSMMSTGNIVDPELPGISMSAIFQLVKVAIKYSIIENEKNTIKLNLAARIVVQGNAQYDIDVKDIAELTLYNIRKRNGYNFNASEQHQKAVLLSGSRFEKLKSTEIPVLVIHGKADPIIPIEHSKKLASVLPNARVRWYDNLGHDIVPNEFVDSLTQVLFEHFNSN